VVVPQWVLQVASATALAAGGLFIAVVVAGELLLPDIRPVPLSVVLVGALLAYVQLVAVRTVPRVFPRTPPPAAR
jgi:hypothetical protein